jgi:hypothetical protein
MLLLLLLLLDVLQNSQGLSFRVVAMIVVVVVGHRFRSVQPKKLDTGTN